MRRRELLAGAFATGFGLAARASRAQGTGGTLRIGIVSTANSRGNMPFLAMDARLRELGYVEGRGLPVDFIGLEGRSERFGEAMRALVERKADVIVAFGPEVALKAALAATTVIPIVMVAIDYDPLANGYVKSLAHPGGNVTGIFLQQI